MSLNLFLEKSEKLSDELAQSVLRSLRSAGIANSEIELVKIITLDKDTEINPHCMLRFHILGEQGAVAISFQNAATLESLEKFKLHNTPHSEAQIKAFKQDLVKGFALALENSFKSPNKETPNRYVSIIGKDLGPWSSFKTRKLLRVDFKTNQGPITAEIPIFDSQWEEEAIKNFIGLPRNIRTLVVHDSVTSCKVSTNLLNMAGFFNVDSALNGKIALEKIHSFLHKNPYGLVVADWQMPEMSGLELLQRLRNDPSTSKLPVILATGANTKEEILFAIKSGVSAYIIKPLVAENFYSVLRKISPN